MPKSKAIPHDYYPNLESFSVASNNNNLIAYSVDFTGEEMYTIKIINLYKQKLLANDQEIAKTTDEVVWEDQEIPQTTDEVVWED